MQGQQAGNPGQFRQTPDEKPQGIYIITRLSLGCKEILKNIMPLLNLLCHGKKSIYVHRGQMMNARINHIRWGCEISIKIRSGRNYKQNNYHYAYKSFF